jgi:hypothetical protein
MNERKEATFISDEKTILELGLVGGNQSLISPD